VRELEPLQKLDEAILALKAAGYVFSEHTIVDKEIYGTHGDYSNRIIRIECSKDFPAVKDEEASGAGKLRGFSEDGLASPDQVFIQRNLDTNGQEISKCDRRLLFPLDNG